MNTDREFTMVTYEIQNAATPTFLTPKKAPVAPNSEFVKNAKDSTPILRLTGTIVKGGKLLTVKNLTINAGKYRRADTLIIPNSTTNTITVTMAEFKKGRANSVRAIDENDAATVALLSFFAPAPAPKVKN